MTTALLCLVCVGCGYPQFAATPFGSRQSVKPGSGSGGSAARPEGPAVAIATGGVLNVFTTVWLRISDWPALPVPVSGVVGHIARSGGDGR
ncbi:hypothetical protein [Lentzea sp.]|uniref:hypothetical protein n=1 Tax=Lentzea sp. TaxID=56099 RepID=UPI002ED15925